MRANSLSDGFLTTSFPLSLSFSLFRCITFSQKRRAGVSRRKSSDSYVKSRARVEKRRTACESRRSYGFIRARGGHKSRWLAALANAWHYFLPRLSVRCTSNVSQPTWEHDGTSLLSAIVNSWAELLLWLHAKDIFESIKFLLRLEVEMNQKQLRERSGASFRIDWF